MKCRLSAILIDLLPTAAFSRSIATEFCPPIEQDVDKFEKFVKGAAAAIVGHPGLPPELTSPERREHWVAAKMIGRWKDGTSLVRFPNRPGTGWDMDRPVKADNG